MSVWAAVAAESAANSDPTWLTVIAAIGIGTVLSSAITAASLITQNRKNGEREDRRRVEDAQERGKEREHTVAETAKEREHQREILVESHTAELSRQRETDRRAQQSQLLRDKMNAYERFLTAVQRARRQIGNKTAFRYLTPNKPLPKLELLTVDEIAELQMGAATVAFFCPRAVDEPKYKSKIEAASEVMLEALQTIATVYEYGTTPPSDTDYIREMVRMLNLGTDEYVQGVREELDDLFGRDRQALPRRHQGDRRVHDVQTASHDPDRGRAAGGDRTL